MDRIRTFTEGFSKGRGSLRVAATREREKYQKTAKLAIRVLSAVGEARETTSDEHNAVRTLFALFLHFSPFHTVVDVRCTTVVGLINLIALQRSIGKLQSISLTPVQ